MSLRSLFAHRHRFDAIAVEHRKPLQLFALAPPTRVLFRCRCQSHGHIRIVELPGNWTLAQVRGHRDHDSTEQIEAAEADEARAAVTP